MDITRGRRLNALHGSWGKYMTIAPSSRAACLLLIPVWLLTASVCAQDGDVQLLNVGEGVDADAGCGGSDRARLILTAGTLATDDESVPRPQVSLVESGTSSRRARKDSVDDMQLQRLPWQNQQLVQGVVDEVSIFRRLPAFRCEVAPGVHDFFVHQPEVAVSMWRAMGISQLQLTPISEWSYEMDTRDGTTGKVHILYRSRESCLIFCNGMFKSPYVQSAIAARAVMHLQTSFSQDESGRTFATHRADVFVSFPSQRVETVAKLISPVSNMMIDRNFQEISLFIHVMWLAMGRQPGWVEQIADHLEGVTEEQRNQLIKLTAQVYVDTQKALHEKSGTAVTLDRIRPPVQEGDTRPVSGASLQE
jgi:hypothetical protein